VDGAGGLLLLVVVALLPPPPLAVAAGGGIDGAASIVGECALYTVRHVRDLHLNQVEKSA